MSGPTIVVIDDSAPFRRALRAVATAAGCHVVAEADGPAQARAVLKRLDRPDLVLLDVNLGADSAIELARELATADPALRIVLVSTMEERDLPSHVRQVGAIGFVEKSRIGPDLVRRLTQASRTGECWHSRKDTR